MKTPSLLALGLLLGSLLNSLSQPTVYAPSLYGLSVVDHLHAYANPSTSLGANVEIMCTYFGTPLPALQWQQNGVDLLGQTNNVLILNNVQLTNAGDYRLVATNLSGSATSVVMTLTVDTTFTKINTDPIVSIAGHTTGGTWGDYNNDGFLDLYVYNGMDGNAYQPYLYRNNGDGTFTKVTTCPLTCTAVQSYSACWGDFDNDGFLDLFQGALGAQGRLHHNNGDGTFSQLTNNFAFQVAAVGTWGDYDNDGFLDLYLGTYGSQGYLYHNNGEGTFTQSSIGSPVATAGGGAWGDYDNDGHPDLFTCSFYSGTNVLYHNNGDGTFTQVSTGSIVTDIGTSASCAWGDYDNDGYLDLFVANGGHGQNFLYHNNGDGTFTRVTNGVIATDAALNSQGCSWGDYDNDGWLDLYVGNEGGSGGAVVVNFLYHNNGDGTFTKITTGSLANEYSDSFSVTWADYDNDGFLDLFASRGDGRGNYLFHNNGNSNAWLTVKLVGTASNRAAIGAKVRVHATIGGKTFWQLRQITGGSGLFSNNELRANFGLGDATNIDQVRIEWPSGIVQTLTKVAPKQILTVVEHQEPGAPTPPQFTSVSNSPSGATGLSVAGPVGFLYVLEGSTDLGTWTKLGVKSNATGNLSFTDKHATNYASRFYRVSVP